MIPGSGRSLVPGKVHGWRNLTGYSSNSRKVGHNGVTKHAANSDGTQPPSMGQHSNLHTLVLGAWPQRTQKSASRKGLLGFRSLRKLPRVEGLLLSLCNRQICLYIVKQPSHAVVQVSLCYGSVVCQDAQSWRASRSVCHSVCVSDAVVSSCWCPDDSFSFPLAGTFPFYSLPLLLPSFSSSSSSSSLKSYILNQLRAS